MAAPAYVQAASGATSGVNDITCTFPTDMTAGNEIVAFIAYRSDRTLDTATMAGWTWTQVGDLQGDYPLDIRIVHATVPASPGATLTWTDCLSELGFYNVIAFEVSGFGSVDQYALEDWTTNVTSAAIGPTGDTTVADELALAFIAFNASTPSAPDWSTDSFTARVEHTATYDTYGASKTLSSTGAVTATVTWTTAAEPIGGVVTLAPPAGGGADVSPACLSTSSSFPAVTVHAGTTTSPASLTGSSTFPAVTVKAGTAESPACLATLSVFLAVSLGAGASTSPACLATGSTFPVPTVTGSGAAAVSPAVLATASTFPAAATHAGAATSPATLATSSAFPAFTLHAGTATSPACLAASSAFPAVTVQVGSAISPAALQAASAFPACTARGAAGAQVTPDSLATTSTFPPPAAQNTPWAPPEIFSRTVYTERAVTADTYIARRPGPQPMRGI